MTQKFLKTIGGGVLAAAIIMLAAQIQVCAQERTEVVRSDAEQSQEITAARYGGSRALEGSWSSNVTFRVCQTGAAIRTFPSMNTFARGGTMHEFGVASGILRSAGQGVWSHLGERRFYSAFQFFRFNADGTYAGKAVGRRYMEVDFLGTQYTSTNTTDFLDVNGNLIMTGCATEVGTRFQ